MFDPENVTLRRKSSVPRPGSPCTPHSHRGMPLSCRRSGSACAIKSAPAPVPQQPAAPANGLREKATTLEDMERRHILSVLERAAWVIEGSDGAAHLLNLHPSTLRSRMKKLGIARGASPS